MAQKFVGFKPETIQNKILPALGYNGPTDEKSINQFLAANPAAAAKMGRYTMAARQMVEGKPVNAFKGFFSNLKNDLAMATGKKEKTQDYKDRTAKTQAINAAQSRGTNAFGTAASRPLHTIKDPTDRAIAARERLGQDIFGRPSDGGSSGGSKKAPATTPIATINPPKMSILPPGSISTMDILDYGDYKGISSTEKSFLEKYGKPFSEMTEAEQQAVLNERNMPREPRSLPDRRNSPNAQAALLSGQEMTRQIQADPTAPVTRAGVVADEGGANRLIGEGIGQAGDATQATVTTAGQPALAAAPTPMDAATMDATLTQDAIEAATADMQAAQGQVSDQAQMEAAQMDPQTAASLGLDAAQLAEAQRVEAVTPLQVTPEQLIDGTTVDRSQVEEELAKTQAATVSGELGRLMEDFEGGDTPAWAAGAMRAANAAMAARGLSASSMAGMAITQAAMESALPIAQMDASNKQAMALEKAKQRANFLGMEFDQEFQTKVKNAARISEIANINFSAEQQVAIENARLAQSVDLANLSNQQAKVLADAATMSQIDLANLDNRQRAAVQNAQSFLQMDMANLSNEQQTLMFKHQANVSAIFSDQGADNAAKQFNATSENQTNQFFANLATQVAQFNAEQTNAINRFNAGETNAISQFNAAQSNLRDQFNAQNHLVIAQANARWLQSITTAANAANNQANRDAAMMANNLTRAAYDAILQKERDLMGWAWKSGESQKQRDNNIAVAKISEGADDSSIFETGLSAIAAELTDSFLENIWDIF